MEILYLNDNNFVDTVKDKMVLLAFYADWCPPCKALAVVLEELVKEVEGVTIAKVNIDEEKELTQKYDVYSVPTILLLKDGKVVKTDTGFRSKASLKKFIED